MFASAAITILLLVRDRLALWPCKYPPGVFTFRDSGSVVLIFPSGCSGNSCGLGSRPPNLPVACDRRCGAADQTKDTAARRPS